MLLYGFIALFIFYILIVLTSGLQEEYKQLSPTTKAVIKTGVMIGGAYVAKEALEKVSSDVNGTIYNMVNQNTPNMGGYSPNVYGINYDQFYVGKYYRHDGTPVRGHMRTMPNGTVKDNISYWK